MSGCTTDRSFVSFRVVEDSDVLLSWYITEMQEDETLLSAPGEKFVMLLKKVGLDS